MHNSSLVEVFECFKDLPDDWHGFYFVETDFLAEVGE